MNTRAAISGIGYQIWTRTRWVFVAVVVQIAALSITVHLLRSTEVARLVVIFGLLPLYLAIPFLLLTFTYDSDIASAESTYPRHMLVLPLNNAALVLTPILYGIGSLCLLVFAVERLILRPAGIPAASHWLIVLVASIIAWLSALSWTPFWLPFGRIIASAIVLSAVTAFTLITRFFLFPNWVTTVGLLVSTGLALVTAIIGICRARRGDGTAVPAWAARWKIGGKSLPRARPFASASRAQLWYELRRNAPAVAMFVVLIVLCTIHCLWISPDSTAMSLIPVPFLSSLVFLILPVFALSFIGGNFARADAWTPGLAVPAFLAARPITDNFLVAAKIKSAMLIILGVWTIVFLNVGISLVFPHPGNGQTLREYLVREYTQHRAIVAAAAMIGLVFVSCVNVLKGFAHNLYGRKWASWAKLTVNLLWITVLSCLGRMAWQHPDWRDSIVVAIRSAMFILIAAKLFTAIPIIRAIRWGRIATAAQLRNWLMIWCAVAAALIGILLWLAPNSRHAVPTLIAAVILLLPINRALSMPLAWHHNRHR